MNIKSPRNIVLALLVLVLGGCSGGTGGTGASDISSGAVTDFGSIFVNGVEFSTTGATITRDDVSISESELRKGMVVEVRGSIASSTSGTATTVAVEEAVRGRTESITGIASAGTLIVLGQTVNVDDTTLYDSSVTFTTIAVGDILEVHGHREYFRAQRDHRLQGCQRQPDHPGGIL